MRWFNHLAGGLVFTGAFAAIAGDNILATKTNIACTLVLSLLPDIDLEVSPISKLINWTHIPKLIQKKILQADLGSTVWNHLVLILLKSPG